MKQGTAVVTEIIETGHLILDFDPPDCDCVLIRRELLESMIDSLNETTAQNSRAANKKVPRNT